MDYTVYLDVIGTVAFALSGYIIASKNNFDLLGIIFISFVNSFGGGLIRDMLVDRKPFVFSETYPMTVMGITLVVAFIFKLHKHAKLTDNYVFMLSDSIGLAVFAFTGASVALTADFNFAGIVGMALITAVGGGVVRDIVLNEIPFVFKTDFYGTIAIFIGIVVWGLNHFNQINSVSTSIVIAVAFGIRLLAIKYNWKLPVLME